MNILTFDIEEWFHLLDFDATRTEDKWGEYEVRIHENMERIFRILEETDTKATFFIIGWIAKTYPEVVRKIAEKYEIGSHTMTHQLVWQQSPEDFKQDVDSSIKLLQDIIVFSRIKQRSEMIVILRFLTFTETLLSVIT
jgi:peptidoglycan/xylan/chitin deacetylase (PgdA/CDA1 family)